MADPARTLETDPRWLAAATDETAASGQVVFEPIPFLRDAKAAHQLLELVVLTATFLDRIEEDDETGAALKFQSAALREALAPWVPIPASLVDPMAYCAWIGRIMGLQESVLRAAPISPEGLGILRAELREAIVAQEKAEEQLRLVRADADHLRVVLARERGDAREDFALMRHAAGTMSEGAAGVRLLGSLLDRARNWVQDPELRAEIEQHCPPKPRPKDDPL